MTVIRSKENRKLKLVRKLADRKHREREGLFATEGEDLLHAGRSAGFEPVILLSREGEGLGGDEVEASLLDAVSQLGSGTRAIAAWPLERSAMPSIGGIDGRSPWVYLHGVGDPGNVGSIVRTSAAFGAPGVVLGPACADAHGPRAIRASMGAIFAVPVFRGSIEETPALRVSLIAHGGEPLPRIGARTICLGAEREGLPQGVVEATDATWTIPTRPGAVESLGVAAAAAIALSRIGSPLNEERA